MGLEAAAARVMARIGIWVHSSGDAIEYKIGITAGPKFRWDQPDWGYGVEGYRFMDVLHTGSAKFVKRLEARLTDELMGVDWRCRNRVRGGGGVSDSSPQRYYLYVVVRELEVRFGVLARRSIRP